MNQYLGMTNTVNCRVKVGLPDVLFAAHPSSDLVSGCCLVNNPQSSHPIMFHYVKVVVTISGELIQAQHAVSTPQPSSLAPHGWTSVVL